MYKNYIQLNLINEFFSGYDATAEQKCSKERGLGSMTEQTYLSNKLSLQQHIRIGAHQITVYIFE